MQYDPATSFTFTKVKIAPHVHTPSYYVKGANA